MNIEKILITIDKNLMWDYKEHYFKAKPRARTFPFASKITEKLYNPDGSPQLTKGKKQKTKSRKRTRNELTRDSMLYGSMSLNELLVIQNRMTMNGIKEKWSEFGEWIAKRYGLNDKQVDNSIVEFRMYGATKAKRDMDNLSAGIKFLNDGLFVKSGMYVDDNYNHINPLVIVGDYDKQHPRTEIRISIIDNEIKNTYKKMKIHLENWN